MECACSLVFLKMLKSELDMIVRWMPLGFTWAQYGAGCTTTGTVSGFVFLRQIRMSSPRAPSVFYCTFWLTSLIPGRCMTSPFGGIVILYQQEWNTTLLARHLTRTQSEEQWEVDERGGKTCTHCYSRGMIYSCYCFRVSVDSNCDFNYLYNLQRLNVNLEENFKMVWRISVTVDMQ